MVIYFKKLLVIGLIAITLTGCATESGTTEQPDVTEAISTATEEELETETSLTEEESRANFEAYMQDEEVNMKITLPPYILNDIALFQIVENNNSDYTTLIHLVDGVTSEEKEIINSYLDIINDIKENGKKVKHIKTDKSTAAYHLYLSFDMEYSDAVAKYYNPYNALDIYLFNDESMIIECKEQEKEWCYKK